MATREKEELEGRKNTSISYSLAVNGYKKEDDKRRLIRRAIKLNERKTCSTDLLLFFFFVYDRQGLLFISSFNNWWLREGNTGHQLMLNEGMKRRLTVDCFLLSFELVIKLIWKKGFESNSLTVNTFLTYFLSLISL